MESLDQVLSQEYQLVHEVQQIYDTPPALQIRDDATRILSYGWLGHEQLNL